MLIVQQGIKINVSTNLRMPCPIIQGWLSSSDDTTWIGPVEFIVDSGADGVTINHETLELLKVKPKPVGSADIEEASGKVSKEPIVELNLRIQGTHDSIDFYQVPVSVTEGMVNLIGMNILSLFSVYMKDGQLLSFRLSCPMNPSVNIE